MLAVRPWRDAEVAVGAAPTEPAGPVAPTGIDFRAPRSVSNSSACARLCSSGGFEPAEFSQIFDACGFEREDDFGQVEPFDFGQFLDGTVGMFVG
jgi:hypothetical protein